MKKSIFIIATLLATVAINAQKTFWQALDTTKVYHQYYGTYSREVPGIKGPAAKTATEKRGETKTLESSVTFKLLPNGYPYDFVVHQHHTINPSTVSGLFNHRKEFKASNWSSTDHYSYPAKYLSFNGYKYDDQWVWVVIDGCLLKAEIKGFNVKKLADLKPENVEVQTAYVPVEPVVKTKKKKKKKKMSLKERIKAAKAKLGSFSSTMTLSARAKELNKNLQQKILNYLIAMDKIQKAHPYTAADRAGMQLEENVANGTDEYVKKSNEEWEKSEAGQRYRRSVTDSNLCTIKNSSSHAMYFITDNMVSAREIDSGSSYEYFKARYTIYYSNAIGEKLGVAVSSGVAKQVYNLK